MKIREMRELLGQCEKPLSRSAFSKLYKIPVRTLEDWEAGRRKCPDYVMYLLERCVRADKKDDSALLKMAVERQIEDMNKPNKTEGDIINNRFL